MPDIDGVYANARVIPGGKECLAHILSFASDDGESVSDMIGHARQDLLTPHRGLLTLGIRLATVGDADCTIWEICAITGHQFQTAMTILRHYLAVHPDMATEAIRKLVEWYDARKTPKP